MNDNIVDDYSNELIEYEIRRDEELHHFKAENIRLKVQNDILWAHIENIYAQLKQLLPEDKR